MAAPCCLAFWLIVASTLAVGTLRAQIQWILRTPANSPPPRSGAGIAHDWLRGRTVLFGGGLARSGASFNDTWEWDGTTWTRMFPATSPRPQFVVSMAYDLARGKTVFLESGGNSDTWEWDGTNWTSFRPAVRPSPRAGHTLAYDLARGQVVLFGGSAGGGALLNDTLTWDGTNWTQLSPSQSPSPRANCAVAFDLARRMLVLFGGFDDFNVVTYWDTWEWDGTNWQQRVPATTPRNWVFSSLAHDPHRGRSLLVGASGLGPSTFEWDGTDWRRAAAGGPTARQRASLSYDVGRKTMVLFGGVNASGQEFNDTWELPIQVIPSSLAFQDGGGTSEAPARWSPVHMQCLYDPATMVAQPPVWNGLRYRRDLSTPIFQGHTQNVRIEVATQGVPAPRWSSSLYAGNRGTDQRVVFAGSFAFPSLSGGIGPDPFPFALQFPFNAPFQNAGGPLLVEITVAGTTFLDTGWQVDATADVPMSPAGSSMLVGVGCPPQFAPAVSGLVPWPGALLQATGSSGAPGPTAAVHVLGRRSLAVDLRGVGMPGCTLLQDPLLLLAGSTDPLGSFRVDFGRLPPDASLASAVLRLQSFVLDPNFNAAGLRASGGLTLTLGRGFPPDLATYAWFDRRPTAAPGPAAEFGSTRVPVVETY